MGSLAEKRVLATGKRTSALEGLSLESVRVLVELVANSATVEVELVERRFKERARGFEQVLKFLKELEILVQKRRKIMRTANLDGMQYALRKGEHTFFEHMARISVTSSTEYGRELREMLKAFSMDDGQAILGSVQLRDEHYAARNLLLEAGAIRLNHGAGTYAVNSWFHREFVRVRYAHGVDPNELSDIITKKLEIGLAAELRVFEYECQMVGQRDAANVIHIALENTNAGFDIASIRRDGKTHQLVFRMIEVKAVSPKDWGFTLTKNEIRVASDHGDTYFLYLVPIVNGKPEVTSMEIIRNPIVELQNQSEWTIETGEWVVGRTVRNG